MARFFHHYIVYKEKKRANIKSPLLRENLRENQLRKEQRTFLNEENQLRKEQRKFLNEENQLRKEQPERKSQYTEENLIKRKLNQNKIHQST